MKSKSEATGSGAAADWSREELELAREIHALTWLIGGQLAAAWPWATFQPPGLPPVPMPFPVPVPAMAPDVWSIPAAWPCCP